MKHAEEWVKPEDNAWTTLGGRDMQHITNRMQLTFQAQSENESFARMVVSAFVMPMNPTLEELDDIRTSVSEAVTNAIIHAYDNGPGEIMMRCERVDQILYIEIEDHGCGIENVEMAREPFYTSKGDTERTGMGFTMMESFMDTLNVISALGKGTHLFMSKHITGGEALA